MSEAKSSSSCWTGVHAMYIVWISTWRSKVTLRTSHTLLESSDGKSKKPGKADARNPKAAARHLVAVNLLIASNFLFLFQATSEVQPVAFTLYICTERTLSISCDCNCTHYKLNPPQTLKPLRSRHCQKDDFGGRNTIGLQLNKGHLSAGRFPKTCISLHTLQAGKQLHRICPREKPDYPSS
ncbi:hypothetical protein PGT21_033361 [Puccinia graminis f. sp. tritici]|uniref:Uncharacterized protein n=1 Tax=Puccinia graminis f. sp. tritici TaxID=56615 RepID=A0A5B0M752_PUCGR|nr:hypothetical protein PGT21_033361 [Puccinia graminis f. sp. tritici]